MADMNEILRKAAEAERDAQFDSYMKEWHDKNGAVTNLPGEVFEPGDNESERERKQRKAADKIKQDLLDVTESQRPAPKVYEYEGEYFNEAGERCDSNGKRQLT